MVAVCDARTVKCTENVSGTERCKNTASIYIYIAKYIYVNSISSGVNILTVMYQTMLVCSCLVMLSYCDDCGVLICTLVSSTPYPAVIFL